MQTTERIIAVESQVVTHVRDGARECGRALAGAANKLLNFVTTERDADPPRQNPYGRRTPYREPLLPLEAWLGAGCVVMVLWAVGWL
jgi:hypothetical protein